jgi:hypothetical protein
MRVFQRVGEQTERWKVRKDTFEGWFGWGRRPIVPLPRLSFFFLKKKLYKNFTPKIL